MNPLLKRLHPYPFQRLRTLFADLTPAADKAPINLSIGEPKHPTPGVLCEALTGALGGLASYPPTLGAPELRQACARWLQRRYDIVADPEREILPVNGSREALFSFVQAMIDPSGSQTPVVISPNPFYQIYEGAALLAGAEPWYVNCVQENGFQPDWAAVPDEVWRRTQVVFACSPGNPTGAVMSLDDWRRLFDLSDRYGFVIASDECYSEIHFGQPPLGGLQAARQLGRDFQRIVMFTSLSKRSNAPGLRSGFVAGDAALLEAFLLYRTYHGSAMSPTIQAASIAAWNDEAHVEANRAAYQAKFDAVVPILADSLGAQHPQAAFYLWLPVPGGDDQAFARRLYTEQNVTVLPGSFLARDAHGINPGRGYIRIALVAPLAECVEAAGRIRYLVSQSPRN
ncbi:succinyldiaminopimelate transaminase [Paludibacterium purpuratum]|uniref:Putative 8-amino-7-oxononanoate synthase n=1 Tax=Paludibacterium purpuratum TaxID=1144873 RepID=A0A4R7AUK0_9NEIS|nr:succinyldiaminopimelate transaminase [Paludibacterium purpuratum]TDR70550.1 succinyldiaminopimelate aminotransferase [Paludibacterium purpuratum]